MYTARGTLDRSAAIERYAPLVRRIASQMIAKLPANVELDDLIQAGMIGLIDALSRYETGHGAQFETFATQRIRGAMLDELRSGDWMSRGNRKQQRQIEAAMHKLEQANGRAPAETDIQWFFGVTPPTVHNMIIELERRGLIGRTPRTPRSLRVLLPADQIPALPDGATSNRSEPL